MTDPPRATPVSQARHRGYARAAVLLLLACVDAPPDSDVGAVDAGPAVTGVTAAVDPDYASVVRVTWTQAAAASVWVEYSVDADVWRQTPVQAPTAGEASARLLGVPYDTTVRFRVHATQGETSEVSEEQVISTGPLPEDIPPATVLVDDAAAQDPDASWFLLSLDQANQREASWAVIVDRQGRVVWGRESPRGTVSIHPRISRDGTQLLIDEDSFWGSFDGGAASNVVRMTLDGQEAETIATPGLHHPFTDLPDGGLLWGAYDETDEQLVRRDADGTTRTVWDCQAFLVAQGVDDWCGSNTLWWNEATGSALFSFYTVQTMVEIDGATGEALSWFGTVPGGWTFDPPESQFWFQHGGHLTAAGTLLVSTKDRDEGTQTFVREYTVDADARTLRQVWSYTPVEPIFAETMGEAHRLGNGNTLENFGNATRIQEVTPDGEVVWDIDWDADTLGRSTPIADLYALLPAP